MRRLTLLPIAALCALTASSVLVAQSPPLTPFRGLIDHVSADQSEGVPYDNVEIWHRAISGDGRYVVMSSQSSNLATGDYDDYNGYDDIFLRDRTTGTTTRISRSSDGGSGDGISQMGTISTNGRHVAFASGSTNLVPADTNNHWDVFVRDLDQQRTVRVSVATDGTEGDRDAYNPSLSADGRFVAFVSWATTFAPGVSSSAPQQMYLHDRDADGDGVFDEPGGVTTELISVGFTGGIADNSVDSPRVSGDGRHVLFESAATNLSDVGNPNAWNHLYLRDRVTGQTALIDRAMTGGPSSWGVGYRTSDMTDDGRFITFSSISPDIVWFDMNWQSQVFRYDTVAGPTATTIVSRLPDGTLGDGSSYASSVSADGRYVVFTTAASNLASPPPGASGPAMLAVRDMLDGSFARVDVLDSGEPFDQSDYYLTPAVSADGTAIVLQSRSQGALGGAYSYGASHAFVLTEFSIDPPHAWYPQGGGSGSIAVTTTAMSHWNATTSDSWIVLTDGGGFGAGPRTVQYSVASNDAGIVRFGYIRLGTFTFVVHQNGDGDVTPPVITPIVTGTLNASGWYTSDITLQWSVTDPESEIVGTSGCGSVTFTTDFIYAFPICEATSHGGTTSNGINLRRDTTGPAITISVPTATVYTAGATVTPSFSCNDPYSGTATCTISQGSSPLDTTPGWHTFRVAATDHAGNSSTKSVVYLVGTGVCVPPNDSLRAHWQFQNTMLDTSQQNYADPTPYFNPVFAPGVAGKSWQAQPQTNSYLTAYDGNRTYQEDGYTIAVWLKPTGAFGQSATIVAREPQYRVARYPDGTLRWAFNHTTGFNWVNTGIVLPTNAWTHVAVTYDFGLVKTYINGQLAHTHQLTGSRIEDGPTDDPTIGGRPDVTASYFGWMDELELYQSALSAAEIDALVRAGSGSTCLPKSTTLSVTAAPTIPFGPNYPVSATLRDDAGNPLADRWLSFFSLVGPGPGASSFASCVTDSAGQCSTTLAIPATAVPATYNYAAKGRYNGDAHYVLAEGVVNATLVKGTPAIAWPSPAAITYGAALGAPQLNATAGTAGTFTYSPPAGTALGAGTHTLSVTFTPTDTVRWNGATSSTTLVVNKAAPVVTAVGGTFAYDKQGHAGSGSAAGVSGEALSPVDLVYNGSSSTPPMQAGNHTVRATYAGSQNYLAAESANAALTINRATPTVDISTAPVWYTGYPRPAMVTVHGVDGDELNPFVVRYDGSTTAPTSAGTYALEVQYAGSTNYAPVTATGSFVIRKATPIIGTLNDITGTYNGQPWGANVNIAGVAGEWLTPVIQTYNGSTDVPVNAGVYAAVVRYDGSANYEAITRTYTVTILKAVPYLQWGYPSSIVYGTPLGAAQLNPTSNVAGTFTYSPPAGTVLNAGSHTLEATFTPGDTANYTSPSISRPISVSKANAHPVWYRPADVVYGTALGGAQLNATASVAGTFAYTPAAGTVLHAGEHVLSVTFTPADAANYNGGSALVPFTVLKAVATMSWPNPADIVYGTALGAAQLNATGSVAGTFNYSPAAGTVLGAGSQALTATFTPDDAANYNGSSVNVTLYVTKAATTVSWSNPAPIVYGTALDAAQLNATGSVAGTFSYSPAPATVLGAGAQTLSVTFTPDDAANYHGASANVSLTVNKAASTISWSNPADIVYGTALGVSQLNATANVAGMFSYSPAAGTALGAGAHTLAVTFTPDDAANYDGASANVSLTVTRAASTISWSNPADIVYGAALGGSQLNATANVPGTLSYSPAAGTVLNAGSHTLTATFTPADTANYAGAAVSATINVAKAGTSITWPVPAAIVHGAPLGAAQLNATASVAGTFSYSPTAGTALGAGSHTLAVTFAPDDATNYNGASSTVSLTVTKADAVVIWNNPANIIYGAALGAAQLNATANVAGTFSYSPAAGTVPGAGSYTLAVTFTPADAANYNGSSASRSLTVTRAPLTITASNATKVYGAPLPAFSATGSGFVNGDSMASLTGTLGFTTTATASSAVGGGYPITSNGVSSANYTIAFANGTLTVVRASTATAVAASPNPDGLNQAVTLTAVVSVVAPGAGIPTGIVQFFDGSTLLGSATTVGGSASLTTNGLTAGSHSISATYAGDVSFAPGSGSGSLTVKTAAQSSTTAVTSSVNPSNTGQTVTVTATVTAPAGLSGSVAFYNGSTLLATRTLSGTTATFTTSALANGGHAITARYLGNATIPPSTSTALAQYVKPSGSTTRTSTTTVTASPSPATLGGNVTLTATVTGSNNRVPTGQVLFMVNGTVIGQATVSPIGGLQARATFSTSSLAHGTHKVQAVYLGDTVVRASAAAQISLVVN